MAAIDEYLKTAYETGNPKDQIANFRRFGYVPQPKQLKFHAACRECDTESENAPTQVGFGGARGPGKSHASFAQMALDDCQRVKGLKCLYLRKVGKQAREQFEDLRLKVLPHVKHHYRRQQGVVEFDNGSRILIGHFKDAKDIDNYLGIEYDVIDIEEATTLSHAKYKALRDSNRTSKEGFRARIYTTTNPGGVGHAWYKARFVTPYLRGEESDTRFIPALVTDNVHIDPNYRKKLEENTGWKLRAYRYGDWDIAAGQFFTTFDYKSHVLTGFDELPHGWRVWASLDYGFVHYTAVHLFAQSDDGDVYVIDEYAARRQLPEQNARAIHAMLARWGLRKNDLYTFVAGADVFARRGVQGGTIAAEYKRHGIGLKSANVDRINGAGEILRRLGNPREGVRQSLFIADRCHMLIAQLPILEHDPHRPEDVLKIDADEDGIGGDDAYDAFRYGLMVAGRKKVHSGVVDFYAPVTETNNYIAPARSEREIEKVLDGYTV